MAYPKTNGFTLYDLANRLDSKGNMMDIVEILRNATPAFERLAVVPGNGTTSHKYTTRTGIPTIGKRRFNKGVPASKTKAAQAEDHSVQYMDYSESDVDEVNAAPDPTKYRADEDNAKFYAMAMAADFDLFYGNPEENIDDFPGLATRLPKVREHVVYDAGGTGAKLSSIYVVKTHPMTAGWFYPKYSKSFGIDVQDLGEVTKNYTENNIDYMYQVYRSLLKLDIGLFVKDERAIKRISNINLGSSKTTGKVIVDFVNQALNRLPDGPGETLVLCPIGVKDILDAYVNEKGNVNFTNDDPFGHFIMNTRGVNWFMDKQIQENETAVTA